MDTSFIVGLVMVGLGALIFVGLPVVASIYKAMEKEMNGSLTLILWLAGVLIMLAGAVTCYHALLR